MKKTRYIVQAALIAAIYTVLTVYLAPLSYGGQQFRVSEALTVLPSLFPAAIPGLFLGCILSNTFSFMGLADMVFGSLATLISAYLTYRLSRAVRDDNTVLKLILIPMPPVVINTFVIGAMLRLIAEIPFPAAATGVFIGQFGACYVLGCPLYLLLKRLSKTDI